MRWLMHPAASGDEPICIFVSTCLPFCHYLISMHPAASGDEPICIFVSTCLPFCHYLISSFFMHDFVINWCRMNVFSLFLFIFASYRKGL